MSGSHFFKKLVGWDLLNVFQKRFLKAAIKSKTVTFNEQSIEIFDMTNEAEYKLLITTVSDRGIVEVLKTDDVFRGRPYLSCSLITKETGSFKVNPSLLQAKVVLQFNPKQIVYTKQHAFWSPTDKYNSREEQRSFIDKLKQQMITTHAIEDKLRFELEDKVGNENWFKIPLTVEQQAENIVGKELLKNIKGKKIDLNPLVSPQTLLKLTLSNPKKERSIPYNEVILRNSGKKDYAILAIVFEDHDFENAMRAAEIGNEDGVLAMQSIIQSKFPIIIIKSQYQYKEEKPNNNDPENELLYACKVHDLALLNKICATSDVKQYGGKALQEACYLGDLEMVRTLIQKGADVNYDKGMPIQTAFYRGFMNVAQLLVDNGADIRNYPKGVVDKDLHALKNQSQKKSL